VNPNINPTVLMEFNPASYLGPKPTEHNVTALTESTVGTSRSAVVFGSGPISPALSDKLAKFGFSLREVITRSGIYSVSIITPDSGILDYLIDIEAFTARDLIYSHADFAAKVSNGLPGVAEAKSFLLGATVLNMFSWDAAGTSALDNHQQRVIGRLLMVIHSCMDVCRDPLDVSVEDDSPMTSVQHDSCEAKYKALYGEQMEASQLVHVGMLGKIARGLATRNLPVIRLSSVYSQTDDEGRAVSPKKATSQG